MQIRLKSFAGRTIHVWFFDGIEVNNLANLLPSWNKIIAEDLMREIERDISERAETIPEMRLFLAVKGYRKMLDTLTRASEGKTGADGSEGDDGRHPTLCERKTRFIGGDLQKSFRPEC